MLGLVLFHTAFGLPFAIFLLRNFFIGIPKDLLESARIDGASELRIFLRLILPLGLPAIASLAIFQFLWTWNDLLVALTFGRDTQPITVAIFSQLRQFGSNIELIAPASFISLIDPAGRVLRLPALLRAGAAGRLGEVSCASRDRRRRARRLRRATRRCATAGSSRPRSPSSATDADPAAAWRRRGGRDPAARDALGERRALPADVVPRARGARGAAARVARRRSCSSVCDRYHPTVEEFLEHVDELRAAHAAGTRASVAPARRAGRAPSTAGSSSTATAPFRHVLLAPGHPGLASRRARGRPARGPRVRAARVRATSRGRRRGHGGGDRVAERARRRRRGRLGAPARAGAASAQRAAPALHAARARRLPRHGGATSASALLRALLGAVLSRRARAGTSRSSAHGGGRFRVAAALNGAEQVVCATGFRRGFAHDPLLRAARRGARPRDGRGLDRARARLDGARR